MGCQYELEHWVEESRDCECAVYIPNAMRLGGMEGNERWYITSPCTLGSYELRIYDRWGGQVYMSRDQGDHWDGKRGGEEVMAGTYQYLLQYEDSKRRKLSGQIQVIQ